MESREPSKVRIWKSYTVSSAHMPLARATDMAKSKISTGEIASDLRRKTYEVVLQRAGHRDRGGADQLV